MKKVKYLVFPAVFALCLACSDPENHTLGIDLQGDFNNTSTQVYVDRVPVFDGALTTNLSTSLAEAVHLKRAEGTHFVKIVVNGTVSKLATVNLEADVYLGVGYDPATNNITITQSAEPTFYD